MIPKRSLRVLKIYQGEHNEKALHEMIDRLRKIKTWGDMKALIECFSESDVREFMRYPIRHIENADKEEALSIFTEKNGSFPLPISDETLLGKEHLSAILSICEHPEYGGAKGREYEFYALIHARDGSVRVTTIVHYHALFHILSKETSE